MRLHFQIQQTSSFKRLPTNAFSQVWPNTRREQEDPFLPFPVLSSPPPSEVDDLYFSMQDKQPQRTSSAPEDATDHPPIPPPLTGAPLPTMPPPQITPSTNTPDAQQQFWLQFMLQSGAHPSLQLPAHPDDDERDGNHAPAPPRLSPFPTFPPYGYVLTAHAHSKAQPAPVTQEPGSLAHPSAQPVVPTPSASAAGPVSTSPGKAKRAKKAHPPADPNRYSLRSTPNRKKAETMAEGGAAGGQPAAPSAAPSGSAVTAGSPAKVDSAGDVHQEILSLQRDFSETELKKLTSDEISPSNSVLATPNNGYDLSLSTPISAQGDTNPPAGTQQSPLETPTPGSTAAAKAVNDIFSSASKPRPTHFSNQLLTLTARLPELPPALSSPPLNLPPSPASSSADQPDEDSLDGLRVGKPTKEETKVINEAVDEIHRFVLRTAQQLNRAPAVIYNALASRSSIAARGQRHPWNVFQPFFFRNKEVVKKLCPGVEGDQPRDYWLDFQKNVPNWQEMLATESALMDLSETKTYRQKKKEFAKRAQDLESRFLLMNQSLGAEGLFIVIGSSVNQDGGLSHIYTTPNAMGFFEDRLRCKESAVVGQLRSHVFDALSRSYAADLPDLPPVLSQADLNAAKSTASTSAAQGQGPPASPVQSSARPPVSTASNAMEDGDEDAIVTARKELGAVLLPMLQKCGVKISGTSIPWVKLPERLAAAGIAIHNIPFGCPFPGEDKLNRLVTSGSGVRAIGLENMKLLHSSLLGPDPPRFVKSNKFKLQSSKTPLFIEAPPPASSTQSFARRRFLNHKLDNKGPPRIGSGFQTPPGSPDSSPSPQPKQEPDTEASPHSIPRGKRRRDVVLSDDEPLASPPPSPEKPRSSRNARVEIIKAGKSAPPVRFVDDDEEDEDFIFSEPDPDSPVRRRRRPATPTPSPEPEPAPPSKRHRARSEAPTSHSPPKPTIRQQSEAPSKSSVSRGKAKVVPENRPSPPAKRPSPGSEEQTSFKKPRSNAHTSSGMAKTFGKPVPSHNGPISSGPPLNPRVKSIDSRLFAPPLDDARLQQYLNDGNLSRMLADVHASRGTGSQQPMQPPPFPRPNMSSPSKKQEPTVPASRPEWAPLRTFPAASSTSASSSFAPAAPSFPPAPTPTASSSFAPAAPSFPPAPAPTTSTSTAHASMWTTGNHQQLVQSYASYLQFCAQMKTAPMDMAAFAALGFPPAGPSPAS
ncbi:hypothetical protein CC2G_003697 [Coprinopsis cinerea AmutBmut pab1-1]|nr:hypothetical protein CC2G_003697 [Coprinopsis cinerea AmutBmut pab1-1]